MADSYRFSYGMDLNGARRKNATRETTSTLKAWLNDHKKNPYPTKGEKIMLAIITKMTLTQVSTWFANARRRLKKENKMTWEPRNRVEDEDNNNEDDDSGRKSVDEKDRLGKWVIISRNAKAYRTFFSHRKQNSASLPQTRKTLEPDRARTASGRRTGWTCSAPAAVPRVSRGEPRANGANPEQTAAQTARSASMTKENLPDTLCSCSIPPISPPLTADCCATRLPRARHLAVTTCRRARQRPRRAAA